MKRRNFIKLSATASAIGLAPFEIQAALKSFLPLADCPDISNRKLVLINLEGGNDGLNTVIPLVGSGYDNYARLRPTIKIPNTGINQYIPLDAGLPVNQQVALHPILTGFKSLYDSGKLRILQSVGYPSVNKSHFKSLDLVASGNDGTSTLNGSSSGWIGRFMELYYSDLLTEDFPLAVQLGSSKTNLAFIGDEESGMCLNITGQDPSEYEGLLSSSGTLPAEADLMTDYGKQLDFINNTDVLSNNYATQLKTSFDNGTNIGTYPDTDLADQLKTVARLISGGMQSKVYMVKIAGFDTHNSQVSAANPTSGTHAQLLDELSGAVQAFMNDLESQSPEIANEVVGLTFSEFGRKAAENGNFGTDHGEVAPMFVFGNPVAGGVSGTNPDLTEAVEGNNYQIQTRQFDYRQTFGTLLQDFIGVDNAIIDNTFFDHYSNDSFNNQKIENILKEPLDASCFTLSNNNNPLKENKKWLVYPNPVNDIVNLSSVDSLNSVSYKLYNSTGVLIMSNTSELVDGAATLNLSHLSSGLYIFELKVDNKKELHKIVKI